MLYELYNQIDYISIHNYWTLSDDYNVIMGQRALEVEQKITIPAAMIKEVRTRYEMAKPIYLVMDEWAPYGRDVFVDCEKFKATDFYKDIPYLDVTSSYSKDTKTMVTNDIFISGSFIYPDNCKNCQLNIRNLE